MLILKDMQFLLLGSSELRALNGFDQGPGAGRRQRESSFSRESAEGRGVEPRNVHAQVRRVEGHSLSLSLSLSAAQREGDKRSTSTFGRWWVLAHRAGKQSLKGLSKKYLAREREQ